MRHHVVSVSSFPSATRGHIRVGSALSLDPKREDTQGRATATHTQQGQKRASVIISRWYLGLVTTA